MSDDFDDRDELPPPPWGAEITPLTEVCGGQYVLLHEIARGDLSIVYRAKPAGSRDVIAFKLIQPQLARDETQVRRFRREIELLKRIEHPSVVRLLDHGTIEDGRDFLALELLEGRTLAAALATAERMSPERTCRIARQVGRALRAMHKAGVIHRDLRPENILLTGPEDAERVKLVDFSEAGDVGAPARRVKGQSEPSDVHEQPRYRAPEQVRKRPPQPSMDVFALGVIMYEMLAGEHPFPPPPSARASNDPKGGKLGAHTIRTKAFDAPEVLLGLVAECIELEPASRPRSMDDVLDRIDKALLWMGVVPHEIAGAEADEDRRTQLWTAADGRRHLGDGGGDWGGDGGGDGVGAKTTVSASASASAGARPNPTSGSHDQHDQEEEFELDLVDDESPDEPPPSAPSASAGSRGRKPWELFESSAELEDDDEARQGGTRSGLGASGRSREEASRARAHEEARRAQEEIRKAQEAARRAQQEARKAQEEARRAQEEAARVRAEQEEAARRAKEEAARRAKEEAARRAQEEAARRAKEEAARRAKEEAARRAQEEAARRAKEEAARRAKEEAARRAKEEAARRAKEEAARQAAARRAQEEAARRSQEQARRERAHRDGPTTGSTPRIDLDDLEARERSSRDGSSSGSMPRIDLDDLERDSAPTGPRFVVDTVAWTKQQPSAEPAKGRKRRVAADAKKDERPPPRTATGSHPPTGRPGPAPRTATGSHPPTGRPGQAPSRPRPTAAHAPTEPLPRWMFPLVLMILAALAYAAWIVWTQ